MCTTQNKFVFRFMNFEPQMLELQLRNKGRPNSIHLLIWLFYFHFPCFVLVLIYLSSYYLLGWQSFGVDDKWQWENKVSVEFEAYLLVGLLFTNILSFRILRTLPLVDSESLWLPWPKFKQTHFLAEVTATDEICAMLPGQFLVTNHMNAPVCDMPCPKLCAYFAPVWNH